MDDGWTGSTAVVHRDTGRRWTRHAAVPRSSRRRARRLTRLGGRCGRNSACRPRQSVPDWRRLTPSRDHLVVVATNNLRWSQHHAPGTPGYTPANIPPHCSVDVATANENSSMNLEPAYLLGSRMSFVACKTSFCCRLQHLAPLQFITKKIIAGGRGNSNIVTSDASHSKARPVSRWQCCHPANLMTWSDICCRLF